MALHSKLLIQVTNETLLTIVTNEVAVLKVIDVDDSNRVADQMTEARLMLSVRQHPHVVRCLNCFLDDTRLCILQEYCDRGDLTSVIQM